MTLRVTCEIAADLFPAVANSAEIPLSWNEFNNESAVLHVMYHDVLGRESPVLEIPVSRSSWMSYEFTTVELSLHKAAHMLISVGLSRFVLVCC